MLLKYKERCRELVARRMGNLAGRVCLDTVLVDAYRGRCFVWLRLILVMIN